MLGQRLDDALIIAGFLPEGQTPEGSRGSRGGTVALHPRCGHTDSLCQPRPLTTALGHVAPRPDCIASNLLMQCDPVQKYFLLGAVLLRARQRIQPGEVATLRMSSSGSAAKVACLWSKSCCDSYHGAITTRCSAGCSPIPCQHPQLHCTGSGKGSRLITNGVQLPPSPSTFASRRVATTFS